MATPLLNTRHKPSGAQRGLLLCLMAFAAFGQDDPHVTEQTPITWRWDHLRQGFEGYFLLTNGLPWFDFGTNGFSVSASADASISVMTGQSPPLKPGELLVTIRAKAGAIESDSSTPPVRLIVDPIQPPTLSIKTASPFEATFGATNWAAWEVQGSPDAATWTALGLASQRTPGNFYFLDIGPTRTNFFYRVKQL